MRSVHPALSFGVEFASTPPSTCALVRGKYSAAVWGASSHRNHFLAPLLGLDAQYEPFLLFLKCRINTLRRAFCHNPERTRELWNQVVSTRATTTGPFSYLIAQLRHLGWEPQLELLCQDHAGISLHVCFMSKQQLQAAVQESWWKVVTNKLPDQPGYNQSCQTSLRFTRTLRRVNKCCVPIVGSFTVGAALSTSQKQHFLSQQETLCKFCGSQDDYSHRLRFCPHYAVARSGIPTSVLEALDDEALLRGLWKEPPEGIAAKVLLDSIPHPEICEFTSDHVCLFTDGSTHPDAFFPLSAWSVVLAEPDAFENAVVESGFLPGRQDNFRAELYAALVAVKSAESAALYSDNLGVVLGFRVLLSKGWVYSRFLQQAETALWWEVWLHLAPKRIRWQVYHVKSHTKPQAHDSFAQKWARHHNDTADEAAKKAHSLRPAEINEAINKARKAYASQAFAAKQVYALQEAIVRGQGSSQRTHDSGAPRAVEPISVQSSHELIQQGITINFDFQPQDFPDALMGPRFLWMLQAWMLQRTWVQTTEWVSILELYLHFVSSTGWISPVNVAKLGTGKLPLALQVGSAPQAFVHQTDYVGLALSTPQLGKQTTVFLHAFKDVLKRLDLEIVIERRKSLEPYACTEPVASTCIVPKDIRRPPHELFHTVFNGRAYSAIMRTVLRNPVQPLTCPVPLRSPLMVWNEYNRLVKAKRRRRNA